jgi:hypothetical protein
MELGFVPLAWRGHWGSASEGADRPRWLVSRRQARGSSAARWGPERRREDGDRGFGAGDEPGGPAVAGSGRVDRSRYRAGCTRGCTGGAVVDAVCLSPSSCSHDVALSLQIEIL